MASRYLRGLLEDVADYEAWLRQQCDVVEEDLSAKHKRMAESPFVFLRSTTFAGRGRSRNSFRS